MKHCHICKKEIDEKKSWFSLGKKLHYHQACFDRRLKKLQSHKPRKAFE